MTSFRSSSLVAFACLCVSLLPGSLQALQFGNFTYTDNGDSITIDRYIGSLGPVVIPSSIDGKPVTTLGDSSFYAAYATSFVIPSSVTRIGANAFGVSRFLEELVIPDSVTEIGDEAFAISFSLKKVSLPGSIVKIGDSVFARCSALESITLPSGLPEIGSGMFSFCVRLRTLEIPASVTSIGSEAFLNCLALESISLPDNVLEIGDAAFKDTNSLKSLTLPKKLATIGSEVFASSALREINIPNSVNSIGIRVFEDCDQLVSVRLPGKLVEIPTRTFKSCTALKSIKIPETVKRIGDAAFSDTRLRKLTLPSSLKEIEDEAFKGCKNLTSVTFPSKLKSVGDAAFAGCSSLSSAIFTGRAPILPRNAFKRSASDFRIYIGPGAKGFTVPKWQNYRTSLPVPEITVQFDGGDVLVDEEASVKFGTAIAGSQKVTMKFKIRNVGAAKLKDLSATISGEDAGDFKLKNLSKRSLSPGKTAILAIQFKPSKRGGREAALQILSNDGNESPFDIKLRGKGLSLIK